MQILPHANVTEGCKLILQVFTILFSWRYVFDISIFYPIAFSFICHTQRRIQGKIKRFKKIFNGFQPVIILLKKLHLRSLACLWYTDWQLQVQSSSEKQLTYWKLLLNRGAFRNQSIKHVRRSFFTKIGNGWKPFTNFAKEIHLSSSV